MLLHQHLLQNWTNIPIVKKKNFRQIETILQGMDMSITKHGDCWYGAESDFEHLQFFLDL